MSRASALPIPASFALPTDAAAAQPGIVFARGSSSNLDEHLPAAYKRALIISTGGSSMVAASSAAASLGARCVGTFFEAVQHTPTPCVEKCLKALRAVEADCIVTFGGGSTVGLGKAVKLAEPSLFYLAVPTTYSGSEMTNILGTTTDGKKTTIRDNKVRPSLVVFDPDTIVGLPRKLALPSLFNAMAHAIEALYAPKVDPITSSTAEEALRALAASVRLYTDVPADEPGAVPAEACVLGLYGAYLSGVTLNSASMGLHHKICHMVGGRFNSPHAETHTIVLPHVVAYNAAAAPAALERAARAMDLPDPSDPAGGLYDLMYATGIPYSLRQLKVAALDDMKLVAETVAQATGNYANPRAPDEASLLSLMQDAYHGRRPSRNNHRLDPTGVSGPHGGLCVGHNGADLARAEAAVICVHGRGANAERIMAWAGQTIAEAGFEVHGPGSKFAILAPQAADCSWYGGGASAPIDDNEPGYSCAINQIIHLMQKVAAAGIPPERTFLFGFSQGACLVFQYLAHHAPPALGGAAVLSGMFIGPEILAEYPARLDGVPIFVGVAEHDAYIKTERAIATVDALIKLGARVTRLVFAGDQHTYTAHERYIVKDMMRGMLEKE